VIWFRAALLAIGIGLLVVVLSEARTSPGPEAAPSEPPPTPRPTRIPLPTLAPEVIISRVARQTPAPLAAPTAAPDTQPQVEVVDYAFSPGQLRVTVGTTVSFVNSGADGHDVTGGGPGGTWRSGPLAPGERYARAFSLPGTYDYVCTIHPEMRGRIVIHP
jgi:plastocyanin